MNQTPYDVWKTFVRLKLHFSGTLDYRNYSGNLTARLTRDAYLKRRDRRLFERLLEEYGSDVNRYMLSCFVGMKQAPSEIVSATIVDTSIYGESWKRFQKVEGNILETFRQDLRETIRRDPTKTLKGAIRSNDKRLPLLLRRVLTYDFNIESFICLNRVVPVNSVYERIYDLDPRVSRLMTISNSYDTFVKIESEVIRDSIREISKMES